MSTEIQLISDGDGVAVIGNPTDVEHFLAAQGLSSTALELNRLGRGFGTAGAVAQAGSEIAANSGRWLKVTEESARAMGKFPMVKNSTTGLAHGTLRGPNGQFVKNLQFVKGGLNPSLLANPALLAGAAGLMAQLAMQQAMDEITEYLKVIDAKVDDIIRAQKDAVLADMIGVDFMIKEAMTVREHVGHVTDVAWSKVQGTSLTIARTQAYALRQLDSIADKLERTPQMGDLADVAKQAAPKVQEWLAVLAHCFQLHDALSVLELDRVLNASPDVLDRHRLGLRVARQNRLELISRSTDQLLTRMTEAASLANTKVLLHPMASKTVVASSNQVTSGIVDFQVLLGIEGTHQELAARRWVEAAGDAKAKVLESGEMGVGVAKRFGDDTLDRAKSMKGTLAGKLSARKFGLRSVEAGPDGASGTENATGMPPTDPAPSQ
ncbi:hypothetical protein ACQBAU_01665 [Propionibacteriaceae bacterium Y2011]